MKKKVVYIGHGESGKQGLKIIKDKFLDKINLTYVVNNRFGSDDPNAVPLLAKSMKIPFYEGRTEDKKFLKTIKQIRPDFGIVMRHPHKILPQFFNAFKEGVFNVHPSDLPKFRGIAPLEYTILESEPLIATSFKITENFDDGKILFKSNKKNINNLYLDDVFNIAIKATNEVFENSLSLIINNNYKLYSQKQNIASTALRKNLPSKLTINFYEDSTESIYRKILARGKNKTPFQFNNKTYFPLALETKNLIFGNIGDIRQEKNYSLIQCIDGCLKLNLCDKNANKLNKKVIAYEFKQNY